MNILNKIFHYIDPIGLKQEWFDYFQTLTSDALTRDYNENFELNWLKNRFYGEDQKTSEDLKRIYYFYEVWWSFDWWSKESKLKTFINKAHEFINKVHESLPIVNQENSCDFVFSSSYKTNPLNRWNNLKTQPQELRIADHNSVKGGARRNKMKNRIRSNRHQASNIQRRKKLS
jgi:hypothetical protein